MTWPFVQVNQLNQLQGETKEVERTVLFIGTGKTNIGKTVSVNTQTDFDDVLGSDDSTLKSIVMAAMANAGQNWSGYIHVIADDAEPLAFVDAVIASQAVASTEGYVLTIPATKDIIDAANTLRENLIAKYGRWVWSILAVDGAQDGETWPDYVARVTTLQKGIAAKSVQLVPKLWGKEPGVLAGRLCNRAVTIADTPARVKTGALIDMGAHLPVDGTDKEIDLATLQALEKNRISVPMWYPDYDGLYWADGRTLDVEGGDFQAVENLRIVDKVARNVRIRAIAKIGDRSLNSTPNSIETHKAYFARIMREMSKSSEINGITFPGECRPPQNGDIVITWKTKTLVAVYFLVRTYECPKGIEASVVLDLSLEKKND